MKNTLEQTYNFLLEKLGIVGEHNETIIDKFFNTVFWKCYLTGKEYTFYPEQIEKVLPTKNVIPLKLKPINKDIPSELRDKGVQGYFEYDTDAEEFLILIYKVEEFDSEDSAKGILSHEFTHFLNLYAKYNKMLGQKGKISRHHFDSFDYLYETRDLDAEEYIEEFIKNNFVAYVAMNRMCPTELNAYINTDFQAYKKMYLENFKKKIIPFRKSLREWDDYAQQHQGECYYPNFSYIADTVSELKKERGVYLDGKIKFDKTSLCFLLFTVLFYRTSGSPTTGKSGIPKLFSRSVLKAFGGVPVNVFKFADGKYPIKNASGEKCGEKAVVSALYENVIKNINLLNDAYKKKLAWAIYDWENQFQEQYKQK